jgi:hypothetical protein
MFARIFLEATISVKNFGVGPADIIDVIVEPEVFDRSKPPAIRKDPVIVYGPDQGGPINDSLIGQTEQVERLITRINLNSQEFKAMDEDTKRLAFHGRIRYRGASPEKIYITRFFWWFYFGRNPAEDICARSLFDRTLNEHT